MTKNTTGKNRRPEHGERSGRKGRGQTVSRGNERTPPQPRSPFRQRRVAALKSCSSPFLILSFSLSFSFSLPLLLLLLSLFHCPVLVPFLLSETGRSRTCAAKRAHFRVRKYISGDDFSREEKQDIIMNGK